MDVVGRLDLLAFFRRECEERGATIVYVSPPCLLAGRGGCTQLCARRAAHWLVGGRQQARALLGGFLRLAPLGGAASDSEARSPACPGNRQPGEAGGGGAFAPLPEPLPSPSRWLLHASGPPPAGFSSFSSFPSSSSLGKEEGNLSLRLSWPGIPLSQLALRQLAPPAPCRPRTYLTAWSPGPRTFCT